ncbi:hypothetical protein CC1G_00730 [Coprinopsis cinerea okayama7|uniref:Uncharacterized protein n=1 Tax=Coprinopsis cinerea (strain Okayama-7 / 130 / ATCC MYA-4618 / FGSC 9003) TaxID=240176 RepID=A8N3H4_COPC7|nr:hypothetical protein CC1G_00730 [Coprinopsis cinerea okayama7\|eukprot:XP_001829551.1 hypothetical protein CC1G_00730 [Coprinopsis cinerea okayama7\
MFFHIFWFLLLFNCIQHAVTHHLDTQHLAQQDLTMADTLDINGMPRPNDITCRYCSRVVPYHICTSTAAGNNGRWVATCNNDHGPNGQPFVHFPAGSRKPTSPPSTPPLAQTATLPDATAPPPMRCGVAGCKQRNLHPKCQRGLCKKDCIAAGGCSVLTHGNRDAFLNPAPAAVAPAQTVPPPPPPAVPATTQPPATRYQPQMAPVFTDGVARRQEALEKQAKASSVSRLNEMRSNHSVTVYVWTANGEPPLSHTFQEGDDESFIWPHIPLSRELLLPLGFLPADSAIPAPPIQILSDGDIRLWTGINLGYVARVSQPGGKIFLKLATVSECANFVALTAPPPPVPHLRHNLPGQRAEVRKLVRAVSTPATTSSKRSRAAAGLDHSRSPSPTTHELPPIQPAPFKVKAAKTSIKVEKVKLESTPASASAQLLAAIKPAPHKVQGVKIEPTAASSSKTKPVTTSALKTEPATTSALSQPLAAIKAAPYKVRGAQSTIKIEAPVIVKAGTPSGLEMKVKNEPITSVRVKQERVVIEIFDSDDEQVPAPGAGSSVNPITLDSDSDVPASPVLAATPSDSDYNSDEDADSDDGAAPSPPPVLLDDGPQWPRSFYACDIIDCLNRMVTRLPDGRLPKPRPIFEAYFPGMTYVRQTVSDQRKRFKLLPLEKQQAAVNAGRTDAGLWSEVMEDAPSLRWPTRLGMGKSGAAGKAKGKKRLRSVKEEIDIV